MTLRGLVVGVCLWLIAATALAALSKNEFRELEDLLTRLGFDPGPVDGVMDEQTGTAIKDYQDFATLPVTGQASRSLLDELRSVTESLAEIRIREAKSSRIPPPTGLPDTDGKSFAIHLASYRTKEGAEARWKKLQSQFPELLDQRELIVRSIDLERQGTFFRVMTGPFHDWTKTQDLCAEFKALEQYCRVIRLTDAR